MGFRRGWVFGLLVSRVVWSPPVRAQCGGTQLCAANADPCTVGTACTITVPAGGLTIDLGARALQITKTPTVQSSGGDLLTINAGSVLVDGGSILAPGSAGFGGSVTINSPGALVFQNRATAGGRRRGTLTAPGAAGSVDLEASSNLTFSGKIKANGTTRDTDGGTITFGAPGNMTVAGGGLDASGGDRGSGGFIDIEVVNGSLVVSAPL